MIKLATLVLVLALWAHADDTSSEKNESARQKRLLFFDEEGSLVKTYSNPYLHNLALNADKLPYYGKFMNPFFNFIRAFGSSIATYTIPVSNAIIQQIKIDPIFQSSLVVIPKNPVVEPSPLCEGMRTQVPSPSLCNNFLNCWDGWAVEQECPTGLLFSSLGYCDYADNVDCHNRKLNVEKLQPQLQPLCSKDFDAFRNQMDCSEFFVCVNRQPVRFKCPADLAYSQYLGVCDYPDRVDCKSTAGPAIPPFQPQPSIPSIPSDQPLYNPPAQPPFSNPSDQSLSNPPSEPPISNPSDQPASNLPFQPPFSNPSPQPPSNTPAQPSFPIFPPFPKPLPFPSSVGPIPIPPNLESSSSPVAPPPSLPIPPSFPSSIPPGASIPPGSPDIPSSPMIPPATSDVRPSFVKPSPQGSFPIPVESLSVPSDKPGFGIFTPGCAATVAMSRQDAIRQLQELH